MKILDILNGEWAIIPEHLDGMKAAYDIQAKQKKVDYQGLLNQQRGDNTGLNIQNSKAIIDIKGPITKGSSFFSFLFGGSSTEEIKQQLILAESDSDVEKIILNIDSPGGTVDGSFELADFIKTLTKPIVTFSDGMIASAAYLIASATDQIFITGKTNQIGSIGVIATHVDYSQQNAENGEVITEVVSGRMKNLLTPNQPLSKDGFAELQRKVSLLYNIFATDVSENRNIEIGVIASWEARIFIGQEAIDAGLVDSVSTLEALIDGSEPNLIDGADEMKEEDITLAFLKEKKPELYQVIVDSGIDTGAENERLRIEGIKELGLKGQEELVNKCIKDKLSVNESMRVFLQAEKSSQEIAAAAIVSDAVKPVEDAENKEKDTERKEKDKLDFNVLVDERQKQKGISRKDAMIQIVEEFPEVHKKFLNGGQK
jgi:signal peptide peptidase SppA